MGHERANCLLSRSIFFFFLHSANVDCETYSSNFKISKILCFHNIPVEYAEAIPCSFLLTETGSEEKHKWNDITVSRNTKR